MTKSVLDTLRGVTEIDEDTGLSQDGSVVFDILDRSTVGVQVVETMMRIAAEAGEDETGRHGWTLYNVITDAAPDVQAELRRVARLGLESFGYVVWAGEVQ